MISLCKEPLFHCIDLIALNLFIFKKKILEELALRMITRNVS
jgi:hypothetical protein